MPLDEGFERDACTVSKSCYEFIFFRILFPPVHWENIQGPEMRIISKKCLSLALLLLTSYSPLLARTAHSNFKEKPFADILHLPVLDYPIPLQLLGGALLSKGPMEGHRAWQTFCCASSRSGMESQSCCFLIFKEWKLLSNPL